MDKPLILKSGVTLPNRFALAPLTNTQSNSDGSLHDDEYRWLIARSGHFGLISTCAAFVSREGHAWDGQLGVSDDKFLPGLTRLAQSIKDSGSVCMVQLYHGGKRATLAPQKISTYDHEDVKRASHEDLNRIKDDFVEAAKRAEKAGFDGVEIHGANGYLFTQFLATKDNPRTDEYGGSLENRARLLIETIDGVKKATSENFMINVRISPVDVWSQRGLTLADGIKLSKMLAESGIDILHLSLRDAMGKPPFEDVNIPVLRAIKEAILDSVKIEVAGGIWTQKEAYDAANLGADIIALGKAGIRYPDWPIISKNHRFQPQKTLWKPEDLVKVSVSPNFIEYLKRIPGLVAGGTPPRNT